MDRRVITHTRFCSTHCAGVCVFYPHWRRRSPYFFFFCFSVENNVRPEFVSMSVCVGCAVTDRPRFRAHIVHKI